jgi:glycosyltransferase involved in cell wall biosynthesis
MRVVTVIPAWNKGKILTERAIADAQAFCDHVVVVDDGSTDDTKDIVSSDVVTVLRHVVNRGQGAALQTGMDFAVHDCAADVVVHFDADGQMRGSEIPLLVAPIRSGDVDVVLGSRFLGADAIGMPFWRSILVRCGTVFTAMLSGISVTDTHNGFRALSRHAATVMRISLDRMAHASEILDLIAMHQLRYCERPVTISYSVETLARGQTTWHALLTAKDIVKKKLFG